ncbi:MAG TPA: DUF3373 family protein [Terriglobales bacterium]
MKKKVAIAAFSLVFLMISVQVLPGLRKMGRPGRHAPLSQLVDMIAGPGRVEPVSEEIQLSSELSGKLKTVSVQEGQSIHKGQILAVLENDDYRAELASAAAEVETKQAMLRKITNGPREQERGEAQASLREAQAVMSNTEAELARRQELFQSGVISREEMERYTRQFEVAKDQYQQRSNHASMLDNGSREEDVAFAQADLRLAQANEAQAQARYEKSFIKSPIDGVILRKHHRDGESVSNSATTPDPVLTIGDTQVLRVRVDIDEADVNKIRVGLSAYVTADAYGKQKVWGHVVQVGELLGPKTIRTDEPTERVDRKFLEALVELDPGAQLPMGLRVDTFIVTDGEQAAAMRHPAERGDSPFGGLLSDSFTTPVDHTGNMVFAGVRYSFPKNDGRTKIGFEFNHGSKYGFNFAQAEDDILAPKTATRGEVYEGHHKAYPSVSSINFEKTGALIMAPAIRAQPAVPDILPKRVGCLLQAGRRMSFCRPARQKKPPASETGLCFGIRTGRRDPFRGTARTGCWHFR